ncbi:MAG TPA: ABC transporter substrate-binding protein [Trueperaceae bacterium]
MRRGLILTTALIAGALALSAALAQGNALVVDTTQDPVSIDPHVATSVDFYLLGNAYEPLVTVAPDGVTVESVLAESWEVSDDGLVFEFTLREGVTFADGTPLDADAVAASIQRLKDLQRGSAWVVEPVDAVEVLSPTQLRITLAKPFPFLQALPLVYIVSPTAVSEHEVEGDDATAWLSEHTAGTGPYQLARWDKGQRLVFTRNEDYWGGWEGDHFDEVTVLSQLDPGTARLLLESGDLDATLNFSVDDLPAFEANPDLTVIEAPTLQQLYLRLNNKYGPTADPRVREAIALAWNPADWQAAVQNTLPADGPTPVELLGAGYTPSVGVEQDLERARELLAEAGYADGFTFNYLWDNPYEYKRVFGELLQAHLGQIGITVNMIAVSPATFFERVQSVDSDGDSPDAIHGFLLRAVPRIPDAYSFLYFLYYSDAQEGFGRNYLLYSNPEVDALIDEAIQTPDTAHKLELYRQANELIIADHPDLFVEKSIFTMPIRKDIQGFVFRPAEQWFPFRFYELHRE